VARDGGVDRSQPALPGLSVVETVSPSAPSAERSGRPAPTAGSSRPARADRLWEQVFSRANLLRALQRVERNGGAPGVDAMTTTQLRPWLHQHWAQVRQALHEGSYRPSPVRQVVIPKPDGGQRQLGVPTVGDRLIQQAIAQVLSPLFDPSFSESSFGFRPGRSAHQAVTAAKGYVLQGRAWVVDVDLDRFFDRVQHDVLLARVARRVADRRLLRLIRRYLDAGIMVDGVKQPSAQGTPQGSPLSPLLANIMLDDLDRQLEARGHRFVRYADDLRVFVCSQRAAGRVLASVTAFVEQRLKLRVNQNKSTVSTAAASSLLGFGLFLDDDQIRLTVHPRALARVRRRVRLLTSRTWGVSMADRIRALNKFIAGWCAYYGFAETQSVFRSLDGWVRRRLRQVRWKEWKRNRTRRHNLIILGIPPHLARQWGGSGKGSWPVAGSFLNRALPNRYWHDLGLRGFDHHWQRLRNT
jgi:RNA-directed DNA polymerase